MGGAEVKSLSLLLSAYWVTPIKFNIKKEKFHLSQPFTHTHTHTHTHLRMNTLDYCEQYAQVSAKASCCGDQPCQSHWGREPGQASHVYLSWNSIHDCHRLPEWQSELSSMYNRSNRITAVDNSHFTLQLMQWFMLEHFLRVLVVPVDWVGMLFFPRIGS